MSKKQKIPILAYCSLVPGVETREADAEGLQHRERVLEAYGPLVVMDAVHLAEAACVRLKGQGAGCPASHETFR